MPEHDQAEATEAAEKALEKLDEAAEEAEKAPKSIGAFSDHKLRSLAALIIAGTSLLATGGTFLKTCDHSLTEHSYNTLSGDIKKLSEEQSKNHDDIVALHGYLEGLMHQPKPVDSEDVAPESAVGAPSNSVPTSTPVPSPSHPVARPHASHASVEKHPPAPPPPVPSVHATGSKVNPPPFAAVKAM